MPDQPVGGSYVYDWTDNRLSPPADPNKMAYSVVDQLTRWPGMYDYTYTTRGDLEYVKRYNTTDVVAHYQYGDDGQLLSTTHGTVTDTNSWDAFGNRIGFTKHVTGQNDRTWSFAYDITAGVPAVLEETRPDGSVVQYFRTPSGTLIASRIKDQGNGDPTRYYLFDAQGSTRCLTDSAGAVTDRYVYDVYGKCIAHSGTSSDNPYQYVGSLGYYTHYQDPELRLLQLGFRLYDPETGRFTQQDPIRDGVNWYAYGGVDPWGLGVLPRRAPDYVYISGSVSVSEIVFACNPIAGAVVAIGWPESNIVGPSVQLTIDQNLGVYLSPGAFVGTPGWSVGAGWLGDPAESTCPGSEDIRNYATGLSLTGELGPCINGRVTHAFGVADGRPSTGKEVEFGTPSLAITLSYGIQLLAPNTSSSPPAGGRNDVSTLPWVRPIQASLTR